MNEQMMIDLVNRIADNDKVAPFQNGFVVLTNEEMVKFAELIVRECLECVLYVSRNPHSDMDHDDYTLIRNKVSQRFGVKE